MQRPGDAAGSGMDQVALAAFLLVTLVAGSLGGAVTMLAVETWYDTLAKPAWTPPDWVFGPVWSVLYLLMAVAAWLVWRERGRRRITLPLAAFGAQLVLNVTWSFLFFGARSPFAGLVDIVVLLGAVLATTVLFFEVARAAGWLMVPYVAWVAFATVLNAVIWRMNA